MTDTNRSLSEVPALITERRRYESWLVALDARRDSTPSHVFARVQGDYQTRLERVIEQIEAHRHIIDEERTSVQSRLSLLDAEERMRRDERAELELRAHVGELVGDDATLAFMAVDESIEHLVNEKKGLQGRVDELVALLEHRDTPPLPRASGQTVNADILTASALATPETQAAPVTVAAPEPARPESARSEPARPEPTRLEPTRSEPARSEPAPAAASAAPAKPAPAAAKGADGSFDELAFLNNVVGQGGNSESPVTKSRRDAALVRDERAAESLLAGLANPTANASAEKPLAANVTGNVPITLRAGASEQPKTLKCNECGGLNYPTEWYCERCGAELAAL